MTSINDVADLPKRLEAWAEGKGYRESFGIDAERAMADDLRKLLSLTVQGPGGLAGARIRLGAAPPSPSNRRPRAGASGCRPAGGGRPARPQGPPGREARSGRPPAGGPGRLLARHLEVGPEPGLRHDSADR